MRKKYRKIEFPALTKEQEEELEALGNMREEDINIEDIPEVDFTGAHPFYSLTPSEDICSKG